MSDDRSEQPGQAEQAQQAARIAGAIRQVLGDSLGYLYPAALRVAVRAGIPDRLVAGPRTAEELAAEAGLHGPFLYRVLRFLATRGVFREDGAGAFHLTPAAQVLRSDVPYSVRSPALLFTDEMYWKSAERLEDTVREGTTVFDDIFGIPLFDRVDGDGAPAELFSAALDSLSATEESSIADSYGFPASGTVIDLAGGTGGFLRTVLAKNPKLRGILFERAAVLRRHRLDDPAVAGRWETTTGDLYESVPPGGDVYVLKRIIHDKSRADCLRILGNCRKAMGDDSRLLIVDAVVPREDVPPGTVLSDVLMLTVFEGKERTEDEFASLLEEAGLRLLRVHPTPGSLSITEAAIG
ncbi:methyltransferase [Kitasatospora sp. NPDC056076]|uniref:methyltransferase n=1 Tax=Kitasatospora sp. NPDC056076 TaxID=3345703 RepID=UPI0035E23870